jgi:hypothetical protein
MPPDLFVHHRPIAGGSGLSTEDRATLKRWRSGSMKPGSDGMKELSARINADLARTLQNKAKSAIMRPDWK